MTLTGVVFTLISVLGISSCNSTDQSGHQTASQKQSPQIKAAPDQGTPQGPLPLAKIPPHVLSAEMKSVSGEPIKLSNYSGKVLLVNLWASWCGPCRNEIPELVRLHKEYLPKGVEMVGLSTENPETSADSVRSFVKDYSVDYKIGWASPELELTLMQGRDSIPQSFIISRSGQIVKRFIGFNSTFTPPQIKQALEDALKS
jgi:thiol-disulfide isomerase/thioredoxin